MGTRDGDEDSVGEHAAVTRAMTEIQRAFDGVPPPGPESRTLRQAEAWDDYDRIERGDAPPGRWQELPEGELRSCQNALPHLDADGLRYYLPAAMSIALRSPSFRRLNIFDSLLFTFQPAQGGLRDYQRERLGPLTFAQRRAVLCFIEAVTVLDPDELYEDEELLEPWRRVVDAGDVGDVGDWVHHLY